MTRAGVADHVGKGHSLVGFEGRVCAVESGL